MANSKIEVHKEYIKGYATIIAHVQKAIALIRKSNIKKGKNHVAYHGRTELGTNKTNNIKEIAMAFIIFCFRNRLTKYAREKRVLPVDKITEMNNPIKGKPIKLPKDNAPSKKGLKR